MKLGMIRLYRICDSEQFVLYMVKFAYTVIKGFKLPIIDYLRVYIFEKCYICRKSLFESNNN